MASDNNNTDFKPRTRVPVSLIKKYVKVGFKPVPYYYNDKEGEDRPSIKWVDNGNGIADNPDFWIDDKIEELQDKFEQIATDVGESPKKDPVGGSNYNSN